MAKVVIIDDDREFCHRLAWFFKKRGHDTISFTEIPLALDYIQGYSIEIVFCSLRLPASDGKELFQKIKRLRPEVPVMIIPGYPDTQQKRALAETRPDRFRTGVLEVEKLPSRLFNLLIWN